MARNWERTYVFGYGSLAEGDATRLDTLRVCHTAGLRRTWNVAMDNTQTLPGYKYYLDRTSGERPSVFVTFLNLVEAPGQSINGVLVPVTALELVRLDSRERNYQRLDVSDRIAEPVDGKVWAYLGTPAARRRYDTGVRAGTAVVDETYYEGVRNGFAALGDEPYIEYLASTDEPTCPRVDLLRFDLGD